jgi:hypothetical protein
MTYAEYFLILKLKIQNPANYLIKYYAKSETSQLVQENIK